MDQHKVWEAIAPSFDASRRRTWPHVEAFLRGLPAGRVLDLMCGNGRHGPAIAAAGHEPVGADFSRPLVAAAAAHMPAIVADATCLPFTDAAFDACIYVAGWHGIPDAAGRAASLHELRRVVKPGGQAQITVWSRHAPRFANLDLPPGPQDVIVPWRSGGLDLPRTYHLATEASWRSELEAAGWHVAALDAIAIAAPEPDNLVAVVD